MRKETPKFPRSGKSRSRSATPAEGYVWIVLDIGAISENYTNISFDICASVTDSEDNTYYNAVYAVSVSAPAAQ